jgi:hypothetical protein
VPAPAAAEVAIAEIDFRLDVPTDAPSSADPDRDAGDGFSPSMTVEVDPSAAAAMEEEEEAGLYGPASEAADGFDTSIPLSFGAHVESVKWELGAVVAYMTAINLVKLADKGSAGFSFQDEGFFGRNTVNLGIDKLSHAHNSYVLAELIAARIRRNTGTTRGTAVSGALLAAGVMFYSELFDGIKATSGFGANDLLFNSLGAGFSVLRNTTPGLEEKLDFRVLVIPNRNVYTYTGL